MKICILGWGSLLWEDRPEFDKNHCGWILDGPALKLEFSRISDSRSGALTLVIDPDQGELCKVAYTETKRDDPNDAICDLRSREGTTLSKIGYLYRDGSHTKARDAESCEAIRIWARERKIDVVIWTDLESNFSDKRKTPFTIEAACSHVQQLGSEGKIKAAEYIWRAPSFVNTPLRRRLQQQLGFR